MRRSARLAVLSLVALAFALPLTAAASVADATSTFTYTKNMHPLGHSARNVPLENAAPGAGIYNSDLAFWGRTAYQGTYSGFRIVDISDPENPVELKNYEECSPGTTQGNQGDVIVWGDLLVRSWNSPATASSSCDGRLVGAIRHKTVRQMSGENRRPMMDTIVELSELYWVGLAGMLRSLTPTRLPAIAPNARDIAEDDHVS